MPALDALWTDDDLREAIAAYRDVMSWEQAFQPFNKTRLHRTLSEASVRGLSPGAFGRRMSNISSTLENAGLERAQAYEPTLGNVGTNVRARILAIWAEGAITPTADRAVFEQRTKTAVVVIKELPAGQAAPAKVSVTSTSYVRDPAVAAWVLKLADGECEGCEDAAPFYRADGSPFLECHHVVPLADGGPDVVSNCVALCPNCHRRLHHSSDRVEFRAAMIIRTPRLVEIG